MEPFDSWELADAPAVVAPDGSLVRPVGLLAGAASLARFELAPGAVTRAVTHATVQEIWQVLSGSGLLWRRQGEREEVTALLPGTTVTIPLGTHFQFRADQAGQTDGPGLVILGVTVPPWPGDAEARVVAGPWAPALG
ncbi:cupin domain-containing protein [Kitasatospora azatica]|uniref:hypothetical protein n=1 Tax=Kitasatospora azatica TaxID=58347 RepID=UPI0007C8236D|nr:hypothetical protein [Kitasatospora azatica]